MRGGCHAERGGVNASAGAVETVRPPVRTAVASRATPPFFWNLFTLISIRSAHLHPFTQLGCKRLGSIALGAYVTPLDVFAACVGLLKW